MAITKTTRSITGSTRSDVERKFIVPDDGIIHYEFKAEEDAQMITVWAECDSIHSLSPAQILP